MGDGRHHDSFMSVCAAQLHLGGAIRLQGIEAIKSTDWLSKPGLGWGIELRLDAPIAM
ncbi:hypothetical protein Rmet_6495 [Cupriavidus metallidurans CH34]|uniref:Uncharacterized protein n=1 Tax=Cupriavidus metallidurans (strain ATCC 43123 / DSM 2839 / NBRC 102507 / CH34) TaxID=266264 RepID=D3DXT3_CUPMC|nr:hypothetical protein Rmet_6495 [Cupriavidus metallidurans CH34]